MLPGRHLALGTVVALPLAPLLGWQAAALWTAAILVDADHSHWYVRPYRRWNPAAAAGVPARGLDGRPFPPSRGRPPPPTWLRCAPS